MKNNEDLGSKENFEQLDSTKVGREGERIVRNYYRDKLKYPIVKDIDINYDTSCDLIIKLNGKDTKVEIKTCTYRSRNIPIEYEQQNKQGEMMRSCVQITEAEYIAIYKQCVNCIYVFSMDKFREYFDAGYIGESDSKECNLDSDTGKTLCYIVDMLVLEQDGFFDAVYENVSTPLDK